MLGLGWTEMLVIGVVALIVIGPKDLPVVMNRIGKIAGQIRRMGSDFQREINKTTGLDEVRNLRNSITEPLRKTSEEIRREFNSMTPTGPKPSGVIKPAVAGSESVVDEIRAAAGVPVPPKPPAELAKDYGFKPTEEPKAAKPVAVKKVAARAKPAPTSPVTTSELEPVVAKPVPAKKPAARKPAAPKADAPAKPTKAAAAAEPKSVKKRAPAKPKAPVAPAAKVEGE